MFRRLEHFSTESDYITSQQTHYDTLPNLFPSATSGLPGFNEAIRTTDTIGAKYQRPAVNNPDQIFMQIPSADLVKRNTACATGSIDDLIAGKSSKDPIGCGWLYSRPPSGSAVPALSQGALGDKNGPIKAFIQPGYKQFFFDLQEAKKTALIDKCKALKACTDVDSAVFNGVCGLCIDTHQGVPIDAVGKPLYADATCGTIITDKNKCPPEVPQGMIDRTCEPVNGRLSLDCLHRTVLSGGCGEKGALALSLAGSQNDVENLSGSYSVKLYNRQANPVIDMTAFTGGRTTVDKVLQETRQIVANKQQPATSAIGAAARDLCLQRGLINGYDSCSELNDSSTGPFDMRCLQQLFLKAGGNQKGSAYPNVNNMSNYNNSGTIGAIKQYWAGLIVKMKGATDGFFDYQEQSKAMQKMLGIKPDALIIRTPYKQGVEVFWFVAVPNDPHKVAGFLRRTVESKLIQFDAKPSGAPQIYGAPYRCMLQLTDLRAPVDFSATFSVLVDDGFWVSVNNPATIDEEAMQKYGTIDKPGLFENLGLQGSTQYNSVACTPFNAATPNIMKLYHEDAGGGWEAFKFGVNACVGTPKLDSMYLSLTCEPRAPFLTFEVSGRDRFEELRNPGFFGQFIGLVGLDIHTRTDERTFVPGKKSFVRINSASSAIDLKNIAYQSWKSMTVAIRIQTTTVAKDSLIELACGPVGSWYFNVIAVPSSEGVVGIRIEYNVGRGAEVANTSFTLSVQTWGLLRIDNIGTGFVLWCDSITHITESFGFPKSSVSISAGKQLWLENATWNPTPGHNYEVCNVTLGTAIHKPMGWSGMYGTGPFTYDIGWVHFFQDTINDIDMYKDAKNMWIYTKFPSEYNKYS